MTESKLGIVSIRLLSIFFGSSILNDLSNTNAVALVLFTEIFNQFFWLSFLGVAEMAGIRTTLFVEIKHAKDVPGIPAMRKPVLERGAPKVQIGDLRTKKQG
jgi:hypothetical protein